MNALTPNRRVSVSPSVQSTLNSPGSFYNGI
jgi:hypothetical protein